jgi:hypothetical protein
VKRENMDIILCIFIPILEVILVKTEIKNQFYIIYVKHMKIDKDKIDKNIAIGWLKVLDPEFLKNNLLNVSMFVLVYEMFKDSVIKNPKTFFCLGIGSRKDIVSDDYNEEVKKLHPKDIFHASCLWFQKLEALDETDIKTIEVIRKHRNDIVHELPKYIGTAENNININLFHKLCELMSKIDKWWILNYEVPINSDFDNQEITEDDVQSGNMILLSLISNILEGKDDCIKDFRETLKEIINEA